jgi:hypothetical protein
MKVLFFYLTAGQTPVLMRFLVLEKWPSLKKMAIA